MESGIYIIRNKINNKIYIGSAVNFNDRWKRHLRDLKKGTHHSIHLQRSWIKYGISNFIFEIVEKSEPSKLIQREQFHLDFHKSYDIKNGYNMSPTAGSSLGIKRSQETKDKIRIANLGKKESLETRNRKSVSTIGIDNWKGRHRPKLGNSPRARSIIQYDLNGNQLKEWTSATEAANHLKGSHGNISGCCSGAFKTAYGFIWKFKSVEIDKQQ